MRQKEGILDDKIKQFCDKNNMFYLKTNGGGVPDCIICVNGYFVAFETKVDKNKMSKLQVFFINKIKKANGIALEIRNYDDAIAVLMELKNKEKK